MGECDNCGAHVSADFARVFAGRGGRVRACPDCPDRSVPETYGANLG